jgi:hypothetical protein
MDPALFCKFLPLIRYPWGRFDSAEWIALTSCWEAWEHAIIPGQGATLQQEAHSMSSHWVSLRRDKLILVIKAVNKKDLLEKGMEAEETKVTSQRRFSRSALPCLYVSPNFLSSFGISATQADHNRPVWSDSFVKKSPKMFPIHILSNLKIYFNFLVGQKIRSTLAIFQ